MDIVELFHITSAASSAVIATLAALLFVVRLPHDERWLKLRRARVYLATAYTILSIVSVFNYGVADDGFSRQGMLVATLFIASAQSLLIAATVFVFICPLRITRQWIILQISMIVMAAAVLIAVLLRGGPMTFATCGVAALVTFIFQLSVYCFMFRNRYADFVRRVEAFYDEEEGPRLKWIRITFVSGVMVGILALLVCVATVSSLPHRRLLAVYAAFTVVYVPYFVYLTMRFISYCVHNSFIVPAVTAEVPMVGEEDVLDEENGRRDADFRLLLDQWVAEKRFLQKDLAVEDIAAQLNTSRSYIYFYFRTYMHTNFRSWRSELRINEAKTLLKEHPEWTLDKIADKSGFNHRANFFQQFHKLTGMKPSEYAHGE